MNEKISKKDHWMLDESSNNCWKCKSKFILIFNGKHHCRNCGYIFCNTYLKIIFIILLLF